MTLVVILTVKRGAADAFRAFETHASRIMATYGGAIERTVVIEPERDDGTFKEVHLVTFPSPQAFSDYRKDPRLREIAPLREQSVVATELLIGEDGPDYSASEAVSVGADVQTGSQPGPFGREVE